MARYDLGKIGHIEFERMCQSLIQQFIGSGVEIYGAGKDGAREATFKGKANYPITVEQWDGSWIFQVKYHDIALIGVDKARHKIIEEIDSELKKITEKYKHQCDNFILLTNVPLSPVFKRGTKDIIKEHIFVKYQSKIKNIAVLGADEICGLLDSNPSIRRTYREYITSGDVLDYLIEGIESEEAYLGDIIKSYCFNLLQKDEKHAVLDDAGDSEDRRVELQDVFIDISVRPVFKNNENSAILWEEYAVAEQEAHSALSYLLDDDIPDIVLVGGPGEGKSTLTQYVSQIHRARITKQVNSFLRNDKKYIQEIEKTRVRIPFRIVLKDYAQWFSENSNQNILVYLAERIKNVTSRKIGTDDIHKIIKKNPIMLILDGLDEVPEKKLKNSLVTNTITSIKEFRELFNADIKVIATTRPFGYTDEFDPNHFLHLNVLKLSEDQAKDYTNKWLLAKKYDNEESKRIFDKFLMCLEDKVIGVLATTPLQVTIVLVIIRARGILPKQREELFETYMDTIYQREQKKNINLLRTEKELIIGLHKYIAYLLQKRVEADETASLMDESEFREHVKKYITNQNPMLSKEGLLNIVNQIIKEAEERLILLTNNPKGKVGFPLTSMREFLTAAHLVDTSSDTNERDCRFMSIAVSPHWRNVVLFFAGRVGRTRPGEVSSMIDVCRSEIDLRFPDKYIKRGANLVIDMIEDRVIRVQRNEMSAIQYAMTLLDEGFIDNTDMFIIKLGNFSEDAKNQIIKPLLHKKLCYFESETIKLIWETYDSLFGIDDSFKDAIYYGLESEEKNTLLYSLEYAIKYNLKSDRIIYAWNKLNQFTEETNVLNELKQYHGKLIHYLEYDLSHSVLVSIAKTMFKAIVDGKSFMQPYDAPYLSKYINELEQGSVTSSNKLFVLTVLKMVTLYNIHMESLDIVRDYGVRSYFPGYINPKIREFIEKEYKLFQNFLVTFEHTGDLFTNTLMHFLKYLCDITNLPLLRQISANNTDKDLFSLISEIFRTDERFQVDPIELTNSLSLVSNTDKFQFVLNEVNRIINSKSSVKHNAHKMCLWICTNFDDIIEKDLDQLVLSELQEFLESEGIPLNLLLITRLVVQILDDLKFGLYILKLVTEFLKNEETKEKVFRLHWMINYYEERSENKLDIEEFREITAKLLEETLKTLTKGFAEDAKYEIYLRWLVSTALELNLLNECHLIKLHELGFTGTFKSNQSIFLVKYSHLMGNLIVLLNTKDVRVENLAIMLYTQYASIIKKKSKNNTISQKLWSLYSATPNKKTVLDGLAFSNVKWSKLTQDFLKTLLIVNEDLENAWVKVITEGRYSSKSEGKELIGFLENILDNNYKAVFKFAALKRLYQINIETEKTIIEEDKLNLPLASL